MEIKELIEKSVAFAKNSYQWLQDTGMDEAVIGAANNFISWFSKLFTSKNAKERLKLLEEKKVDNKTINKLEGYLEDLLDENENLKTELEKKVEEFEKVIIEKQIQITKHNVQKIKGNNNIGIQDVSEGSIAINKS